MAVREYIGARYVPKFDGTHNINKAYEPLTIVTDSNETTSYTSKKHVPVGVSLDNSEYWAITGTLSGAILDLQERMQTVEGEIDVIEPKVDLSTKFVEHATNRKFIFIGDSYTGQTQWVVKVASILNLVANVDYWTYSVGGEGFTRGADDNGFLNDLQHIVQGLNAQEKESITDVVVLGGANDAVTNDVNAIQSGISAFHTYVQENLPNAVTSVGYIGVYKDGIRPFANQDSTLYAYKSAARYGKKIKYLEGIEQCTHNLLTWMNDDIHPNTTAGTFMSWAIVQCLLGGSYSFCFPRQLINYTGEMQSANLNFYISNGHCKLVIPTINLSSNGVINGGGIYKTMTEIGTTTGLYFNEPVYIDSYVYVANTGGNKILPCTLKFLHDKLYLGAWNVGDWADLPYNTAGSFIYGSRETTFENMILV